MLLDQRSGVGMVSQQRSLYLCLFGNGWSSEHRECYPCFWRKCLAVELFSTGKNMLVKTPRGDKRRRPADRPPGKGATWDVCELEKIEHFPLANGSI